MHLDLVRYLPTHPLAEAISRSLFRMRECGKAWQVLPTLALTATIAFSLATVLLLLAGRHLRFASRIAGLVLSGLICIGAHWLAGQLWHLIPAYTIAAALIVFAACAIAVFLVPYWNAVGQLFLGTYAAAAGSYLAFAGYLTVASGLSVPGLAASVLLLILEGLTLFISGYFAFEGCDVLCRARATRQISAPDSAYQPMVCLQVPAFNEPADMLIETIQSLEQIEYPRLEILVVDNNTPDPQTWQPVAEYCQNRERVRFLHIESEGFKAGALNVVMAEHMRPDVEIIGIVDADYLVDPLFLRETVGYFADPAVAFVQTPQDYREFRSDPYLTACYDAYNYFFRASMPSRNQRNSIIFAGTMGLIRRRVLDELGGWPQWCITEDSETSLRMLMAGYQGVYIGQSMGHGIMPLSFAALKRQRFRWCFGGIQILRAHLRSLLPWARNRLTIGQRLDYLFGTGLVWFNDVLYLGFTAVLLVSAYFAVVGGGTLFRPLTGALVLLPAALLSSGLLRAVWSLRHRTGIGLRRSLMALLNWLSLSWTVAMASLQGLVRSKAVFLRTPKEKERQTVWTVLGSSKMETSLALALWGSGLAVALSPARSVYLVLLFAWQGIVYASAPYMSWLGARTVLSPQLQRRRRTEMQRERGVVLAGGALTALAGALIAAVLVLGGSRPGDVPALPVIPRQPAPSPAPTFGSTPAPTAPATPSTAPPSSSSSTASPPPTTPSTAPPASATNSPISTPSS
jgi:cellulose synthase/poly-beta-1,6-N-acetylglucosamine synthase-like glycosyltransferase